MSSEAKRIIRSPELPPRTAKIREDAVKEAIPYVNYLFFSAEEDTPALRAQMQAHPSNKTLLIIETPHIADFEQGIYFVEKFAFAKEVQLVEKFEGDAKAYSQVVVEGARGFIPTGDLVDKEKETARLNKELAGVEKDIQIISGKLNNPGFMAKAPEKLVETEKAKLAAALSKKEKILESLAVLG